MTSTPYGEYLERACQSLTQAASQHFTESQYSVSRGPDGDAALLSILCQAGEFRVKTWSDVFQIIFSQEFVYTTFLRDPSDEIDELSRTALCEIDRVCRGVGRMQPATTALRRKPLLILETLSGEEWIFYS